MAEEPPSIWTMDRAAIEQSLIDGRSPRRAYTEADKAAVRVVLDRADFDTMSEQQRAAAYLEAFNESARVAHTQPGGRMEPGDAGSALPGLGWFLLLASLALILFAAFGSTTAVHSESDYIGSSYVPARDTLNIGLLQNQLMLFLLGLAGTVSGIAVLLTNVIIAQIKLINGHSGS